MLLGALEAGGTKMACAVGDENGNVRERVTFPTRDPGDTMRDIIGYFKGKEIAALGIACFGPLELDRARPNFGDITTTPKLKWQNYPIYRELREALGVPCDIDTDVNAAALAEWRLGAARGLNNCLYVTIGTGVGGGIIAEGKVLHGLMHPEMGHIPIRPEPGDPAPEGFCPFHRSCLEGMACGAAIEKRWGKPGRELADDHPAWELESAYLAQLCVAAVAMLSPERIILGGGVMKRASLFPAVRRKTLQLLNGYIQKDELLRGIDSYIVPPGLGDNSGAAGALLLASAALA